MPSLGLKKYDRLEPHANLLDVGKFHELSVFPVQALFWRRSRETLCTHRSPLFDRRLGVTPNRSIAIDVMHTLLLGPCLSWGKLALWKLLLNGTWGTFEESNEARLRVAIMTSRATLVHWYNEEQAAGRCHNRIDFMTNKIVGTPGAPTLKLKAMEAYGFVQFLVHCLTTYQVDGAADLLVAGKLLVALVESMKAVPIRLTVRVHQHMSHSFISVDYRISLPDACKPQRYLTSDLKGPLIEVYDF